MNIEDRSTSDDNLIIAYGIDADGGPYVDILNGADAVLDEDRCVWMVPGTWSDDQ